MDASDISNIATLGSIFVYANINVNTNSNSLYILLTSDKSSTNIYNINVNNVSIASASLSSILVQANSKSTKNTDTFGGFSWFGASKESIRNRSNNSHGNMNFSPVCVSMSNYNSDTHGNRTNDVSSSISSIALKINENMNNYSGTSLLTIDMNTNDIETIEIKKTITIAMLTKIKRALKMIINGLILIVQQYLFFVVVVVYVKYIMVWQDIVLHQQISIIHYTNHISTGIFVLLFQMVIYLKLTLYKSRIIQQYKS